MQDYVTFVYDRDFNRVQAGTVFTEYPSGLAVALVEKMVGHIRNDVSADTAEVKAFLEPAENKAIQPDIADTKRKRRRPFGMN